MKTMGRHPQWLHESGSATVLGDGQALSGDLQSLLLFQNAPGEDCAIPFELVTRVERVNATQVQNLGGRRTMRYGGMSLPLVTLHDVAAVGDLVLEQQWVVVVFERAGKPIGLLAAEPLDIIEARLNLDTVTPRQTGVAGSTVLNGRITLMLDIFELADGVRQHWPESESPKNTRLPGLERLRTVLVAEDSDFFRGQIQRLIEAVGYKVPAAEDGQSAWDLLDRHAEEIAVVTTDAAMPGWTALR